MCAIDPIIEEYLKETENKTNLDNISNIDLFSDELPKDLPEEVKEIFEIDDVSINNSLDSLNPKKKKDTQSNIDKALVLEFYQNQTQENFNKLWERFFYGVKSYAYKYMHDWDLADDMAVQTFERAWEFKDKYDINKAVYSTWIYTICRNLCLGAIYRKLKDNYVNQDISDMYDSTVMKASIAADNSNELIIKNGIVTTMSYEDIVQKLYDTSLLEIDNIGGDYTKILRMKLVDNMKIREIAVALNMNESTVKDYLYKGKGEIDKIIRKKYKSLYEMYLDAKATESDKMYYN